MLKVQSFVLVFFFAFLLSPFSGPLFHPASASAALDTSTTQDYYVYLPAFLNIPPASGDPTWKSFPSPTLLDLEATDFTGPLDGWIVGAEGVILHWNGSVWTPVDSPTTVDLHGINMFNGDLGFAVGNAGTILGWDGAAWSDLSSPVGVQLNDVQILAPGDAWAVGAGGTLLHWDGAEWTSIPGPTSDDLYALDFAFADDGWAVGGQWSVSIGWYEAAYWHWDGDAWTAYTPVQVLDLLFDVDLVSSGEGVAAGLNNAKSFWDGSQWDSSYSDPAMTVYYGVNFLNMSDGWGVGWMYQDSNIQHWNGAAWSRVPSPVTTELRDVYMLAADSAWSVGVEGVILRYSR